MGKRITIPRTPEYDSLIIDYYMKELAKGTNVTDIGHKLAKELEQELGGLLGESAFRKRFDSLTSGWDLGVQETAVDEELDRLADARAQHRINSKISVRERAALHDIAREIADAGLLESIILENYKFYKSNEDIKMTYTSNSGMDEHVVYIFSDAHFGKNVDLDKNKHNMDIAKKKLLYFFDWVLDDINKNKYTKVEIYDLGDSIEGSALRKSQLFEINELIVKQANEYSQFIQDVFFGRFLPKLKKVDITFNMISSDNHAQLRQHNTGRNELKDDNIMILVANDFYRTTEALHAAGQYKQFTFNFGKSFLVNYDGYKVYYEHGHEQKKGDKQLNVLDDTLDDRVGCIVAGHFHSWSLKTKGLMKNKFGDFSLQRHLVYVPGVVGADDYSEGLGLFSGSGAIKMKFDGLTGVKSQEFINLQNIE